MPVTRKCFGFSAAALSLLLLPWFCLAPTAARAATVTFDATNQAGNLVYWSHPSTWSGGAIPASGDDVGLNTPGSSVSAVVFDVFGATVNNLTTGSTLGQMWLILAPQLAGQNNFTGLTVNTNLSNQSGGQLVNTSSWVNSTGATIANGAGAVLYNGLSVDVANELSTHWALPVPAQLGNLFNETGGTLSNTGTGAILYNVDGSELDNTGANLLNQGGALLYNDGAHAILFNAASIDTFTGIETAATLTNDASTIDNVAGATLTNTGAGTLLDNRNGATILNDAGAVLINAHGAQLLNETGATLTNNATLQNSATVYNWGTIDGAGTYTQTAGLTVVEAAGTFTQGTLDLEGGDFTVFGHVLITGNATNSGGFLLISTPGSNMTVEGTYTQTGTGSLTLLDRGTFDPPAIDIEGGTFGGSGTVDGPVTLTGGSTLEVGDPTGQLLINGGYSQTGGEIDFDIAPGAGGGFVESTLEFDPGFVLDISGAKIVFDFIGGADPSAFSADGLFNIDTFFKVSGGPGFLADFGNIFSTDSFTLEGTGSLSFDPRTGDLSGGNPSVPEPGTLFLLLPGLAILASMVRRQRR